MVPTIDQVDHSLPEKMNIQTDALIGNQCKSSSRETFQRQGKKIVYLNTTDRGVGRNRNLLMQNATADICIFADDDMRFVDGYPEVAEAAFNECPDADMLVFNLIEEHPQRYINQRVKRVYHHNYAKYGAARIAFRRLPLQSAGVRFHLSFGGGTRHGSGEDTIFLKECLKKGLKIYAVPYSLAEIDQNAASTWFSGYDARFFQDKGALYSCLHPLAWPAYAVRFLICYRKKFCSSMPFAQALKHMLVGGRQYHEEGRCSR